MPRFRAKPIFSLFLPLIALFSCTRSREERPSNDAGGRSLITHEAFASAGEAFEKVQATRPRVLAVGEMHAQLGSNVPSSAKRFREELLPRLRGARAIVIELWTQSGRCGAKESAAATVNKEITATQAPGNSNEFYEIGAAAKRLGIVPNALVPSCDDFSEIADAGEASIDATLRVVARVSERTTRALIEANPEGGIVMYGGALHNDLLPPKGREAWSFGPALFEATHGKYEEIDLIVPEAIKETEAWRNQPFYSSYNRDTMGHQTVLFHTGPHSWALVFPLAPIEADSGR